MRVLWFSITSSCYSAKQALGYNGGGWVMSLENAIRDCNDIELGVAFEFASEKFKDVIDGVTYYPINVVNRKVAMQRKLGIADDARLLMPHCMQIVEDFKPDVIQCFGTEWAFGLIAQNINVPVIIHMQGSMPSYYNVLYPPKYSKWTSILFNLLHMRPKALCRAWIDENKSRQRMVREFDIFQANKYFLGRTDWDRALVKLFSPQAQYYHCDEALRESFWKSAGKWKRHDQRKTLVFCTTGSGSLWKGLDVILKTASILKRNSTLEFKWKIIGRVDNRRYIEWMENLSYSDSGVEFLGVLDQDQLVSELLDSDVYVHPSYIDNSPNALCEAMLLGLPCVASMVGGVPSILTDAENGILVPANEPYYLASKLIQLVSDKSLIEQISANAAMTASARHSMSKIKERLLNIYAEVINDYGQRVKSNIENN